MAKDLSAKKKIINDAFDVWYNSRYKEIIASELLSRWQMTDTIVQIGIAITAAGSAVAGWQLWTEPGMKMVWSLISGLVALMAIGHKGFRVVDRVKVWSDTKQSFTMLRNQLETLKYEIETSFNKKHSDINKNYKDIKKSYGEEDRRTPEKDLWLTKSLEDRTYFEIYYSRRKTNFAKELKLARKKL